MIEIHGEGECCGLAGGWTETHDPLYPDTHLLCWRCRSMDAAGRKIARQERAARFMVTLCFWLVAFSLLAATVAHCKDFTATVPKFKRLPCCCAPDSSAPAWDLSSIALFEYGQQSPTWIAKHVVMLANPDTFRVYWPQCAFEANPKQVASVGVEPVLPNQNRTITITYAETRGRVYYMVARNRSGATSCQGNTVAIP